MLQYLNRGLSFFWRAVRPCPINKLARLNIPSGLGDSAWLLYGLVRARKPKVCVEIGSAQGWSACFIATALEENKIGKLFAIDPHCQTEWNDLGSLDTLAVMQHYLAELGLTHRVDVVRRLSAQVAQEWQSPIELLFIDGDHSYEGVKNDWHSFLPHMSDFGIVIFHDTLWDIGYVEDQYRRFNMGVPRFVDELRSQGYPVLTLPNNYGISLVQPIAHGMPLVNSTVAL